TTGAASNERAPTVEIHPASVHVIPRGRDRADARSRPRQMFWSKCDLCDVSSASHQAACLARSAAAGEALTSLMRYTRPFSVGSETRLRPSFLRTTPARKPRTECCCQSVTVMIAAIVAPVGIRSIAMMRACLVSGPAAALDDAGADRMRKAGGDPVGDGLIQSLAHPGGNLTGFAVMEPSLGAKDHLRRNALIRRPRIPRIHVDVDQERTGKAG